MSIFRSVRRALVATALIAAATVATAQNTNSDIATTRHNLSASGPGTTKATSESQICVFCHTPHAANAAAPGPLWNRNLSTATYTPYTSSSLDAAAILGGQLGQPGGSSKLCLSCHDGTLALGTVSNMPGSGSTGSIAMGGTADGKMPAGSGATTGYTRNLGTDLRNDHPISFTFNSTLATRDGELRTPPYSAAGNVVVGIRTPSSKPHLPLDSTGQVQCTTCHDPHLAGDSTKFLRLNRLQQAAPSTGTFNAANDQICLGCHDKLGNSWAQSAHANPSVANYNYKDTAATQREFPTAPATQVWQAACLNCHDTHTVQGARRLLRDGTDGAGSPRAGGNPALENTCYQCHTTITASVITSGTMNASTGVPDIATEFGRTIRMPITTANQPASAEAHDIGGSADDAFFIDCTGPANGCGADFIESRAKLGANNHTNRHVECTDCHNPHRVIKNALFNGQGSTTRRTHVPGGVNGNLASGALRGTWGVEPSYPALTTSTDWPNTPTTYEVKRGDPGANTSTATTSTYLTREYQLCFKCHSDYGAGTTMPLLGNNSGGTTSGTNGMTRYTNIAAEFAVKATDPPTSGGDQGEEGNAGSACGGDCNPSGTSPQSSGATGNNHRSWHPVIWPTGRDAAERLRSGESLDNFRPPFSANLGTQTMQCSDCHGHSGSWTQGATATDTNNGPNLATVQGPHGSAQNFILKGVWDTTVTPTASRGSNSSGGICGRCHNPSANSGFDGTATEASHSFSTKSTAFCMRCHIAVPHGWKNKAFLVNLECVGPEGGRPAGCTAVGTNISTQTIAPYYNQAVLRINTWQRSGAWTEGSCGTSGYNGKDWMSDVGNCNP